MKVTRNELRLGNLLDFEGEVCIVREINSSEVVVLFDNCEEEWIYLSQFNSIPLTEEWLLDFGFRKHKSGIGGADMWQGMDGWSIDNDLFSDWLFRGHRGISKDTYSLKLVGYINSRIEYIHQLQNLYFCLCGKELTLTKGNDPL